jgi:hypothetical protein
LRAEPVEFDVGRLGELRWHDALQLGLQVLDHTRLAAGVRARAGIASALRVRPGRAGDQSDCAIVRGVALQRRSGVPDGLRMLTGRIEQLRKVNA